MDKLDLTLRGISIAADVITLLGVGGIVSWSVFGKDRGPLQRKIAAVFAFSLKTGFCVLLFGIIGFFAFVPYGLILSASGIHINTSNFFWDSRAKPFFIAGYLVVGLLFLPLYLILCSCIYEWSFEPFRRVREAFRKKPQTPE